MQAQYNIQGTALEKYDLIIVGAGAAGLFAAAHCNKQVLVLEKKANTGNKLMIAGQGRCNFTHAGRISDFFSHYGENGHFVKFALKNYSNTDLIEFFSARGLQITEDKNGKLFPRSGNSKDIVDILYSECIKNGIKIKLNEAVINIKYEEGIFKIYSQAHTYLSDKVLITTGGISYPKTGSTGDGYAFAKYFDHSIIGPKPSLSPVIIKDYTLGDLAGVSLKDCRISLYRNNKKINTNSGDIGFTHRGLSGPGILDFSRYLMPGDIVKLNVCGISTEEFNRKFLEDVQDNGKSTIQQFLRQFEMSKNLMKTVLKSINIDAAEKIANISKELRKSLIEKFCELPFEINHIGGFHIAMATAGGVSLKEINPKTMESLLQPGLYFAGEVLDIDGDTGGYNLQAAFSTAYIAVRSLLITR